MESGRMGIGTPFGSDFCLSFWECELVKALTFRKKWKKWGGNWMLQKLSACYLFICRNENIDTAVCFFIFLFFLFFRNSLQWLSSHEMMIKWRLNVSKEHVITVKASSTGCTWNTVLHNAVAPITATKKDHRVNNIALSSSMEGDIKLDVN